MLIYFSHSREFDFKNKLYKPIRNSMLNKEHEIIFPHEKSDESFNSSDLLKSCDLMVAEVSFNSTGLGIELGWANSLNCPIICLFMKGAKISRSLKKVTDKFIEYSTENEMVVLLEQSLKK